MHTLIFYWLPPLVWMAIISPFNKNLSADHTSFFIIPLLNILLPHAKKETIEIIHIVIRKTSHFVEYALLAFLLYRAFRVKNRILNRMWILYAGFLSIIYAALDEYIQTMIPSRTGSFYDWLIDTAGIVIVLGAIYIKNADSFYTYKKINRHNILL